MTSRTDRFPKGRKDEELHRQKEWKRFKNLHHKKRLLSFEEYIDMFLNHFGWQHEKYLIEFCILLKEKGFHITSCYVREAITDRIIRYGLKKEKRKQKSTKSKKMQRQKNIEEGKMFEKYMIMFFAERGYHVFTTSPSHDFGADLILEHYGEKTAVQIKCHKKNVGVSAIQQVVAAKRHYECQKALVVIMSRFTKPAKKLAFSNSVDLWDWEKLSDMRIR